MYRTAAVLAAMVALGMAGCGGDSELTKAELIRQADAVCERLGRQTAASIEAAGRAMEDGLTERQAFDRFLPRIVAQRRAAADKLEGLEPPSSLSTGYESYVASLRRSAELLPTAVTQRGEQESDRELQRVETARNKVAKTLGFKNCA